MDSKIIFGTGGVRGIMGDSDGFLNLKIIRRVTHGLAKVILASDAPKSVGVAYDTRRNSYEFAQEVCRVLSAFDIKVYYFAQPMPTPILSHAIQMMDLGWGVCITASHNPQEYNGYKVYDKYGVQLTDKMAKTVADSINSLCDNEKIHDENQNLIRQFSSDILDNYFNQIIDYIGSEQPGCDFKFIYSALHGAGANAVPEIFKRLGYRPVSIQQEADSAFGGLKTPNPEEPVVYEKALFEAEKSDVKLIIATDPDCDRVGVMVKTSPGFELLNGNQIGALLIDYIASHVKGALPGDTVVSTIVSGQLGEFVTKDYGMEFVRLLTGFKYIGEYIVNLPENNKFFFGYEESFGFLAGNGAKDKDAVIASALIVKMAAYYDSIGMTLLDKWFELSEKHGYCLETLHSFNVTPDKQKELMAKLRSGELFSDDEAVRFEDYKDGLNGLPSADVIKLYFGNADTVTGYKKWAAIRPSGTEPKLKVYVGVCDKTYDAATEALEMISSKILRELRMT